MRAAFVGNPGGFTGQPRLASWLLGHASPTAISGYRSASNGIWTGRVNRDNAANLESRLTGSPAGSRARRNRVGAPSTVARRIGASWMEGGPHDRDDGVLLTGATGFVGMELLVRFLERTDRPIYALVRADSDEEAKERVDSTLRCLFGADRRHARRVISVRGDLTRPQLGLARNPDALAERVSEIVHGAASVSFDMSLPDARAINVEGTRQMLDLASRCEAQGGLRRLSYVSTAYVAGDHDGCFSEDELDLRQRFRNSYEQSKFEAERLLARWRPRLPITVMRPSIIVGERGSGWTQSFNVLYWPLRAFSNGAYAALPARADACVDVVPVDYVADAIFALSQARETEGATLHLTAGEHASNVSELVELATGFFKRPAPRLIKPSLYRNAIHPLLKRFSQDDGQRRMLRRSEIFFPYFATKVAYDNRRCKAMLCGSGIAPSGLPSYFDRLVEFALAARWGRLPISRAEAVRARASAPPSGTIPSRAVWPLTDLASRRRLAPVR